MGCSKIERTTSVSGTVLDFGSGEPIENVKIHLKDGWDSSSPFTNDAYFSKVLQFILNLSLFNARFCEGEYTLQIKIFG